METNSFIGIIPWPVVAATATWFGVMAHKSGKNRIVWAVGGGILGLVVTTIVMGMAQATFIPFCSEEVTAFRAKVAGLAVFLVFCVGWLFTGSLHRHLLASVKRTAAPAPEEPAKSPAPAPRQ